MEDLINSIPKEIRLVNHPTEGLTGNGFCLRWSVKRQKWLCGYNVRFSPSDKKDRQYHPWAEADDPVEAVAFFVELVKKGR